MEPTKKSYQWVIFLRILLVIKLEAEQLQFKTTKDLSGHPPESEFSGWSQAHGLGDGCHHLIGHNSIQHFLLQISLILPGSIHIFLFIILTHITNLPFSSSSIFKPHKNTAAPPSNLDYRPTMAAATSAAVLNGLGSPFLTGGKRTHTLSAAPIGAATGAAVSAPRRLVIAAAVAPKKSWIPAVKGGGSLVDPEWLDGS